MTFKKFALIAVLLIGSLTAATADPASYTVDRASDVGENGGGGGAGS